MPEGLRGLSGWLAETKERWLDAKVRCEDTKATCAERSPRSGAQTRSAASEAPTDRGVSSDLPVLLQPGRAWEGRGLGEDFTGAETLLFSQFPRLRSPHTRMHTHTHTRTEASTGLLTFS